MGYPIPRIATPLEKDDERHAADRIRLFERVAIGLAHEGKNPLHNMVLHLQLMAEELKSVQRAGDSRVEKHILRCAMGSAALMRCCARSASSPLPSMCRRT